MLREHRPTMEEILWPWLPVVEPPKITDTSSSKFISLDPHKATFSHSWNVMVFSGLLIFFLSIKLPDYKRKTYAFVSFSSFPASHWPKFWWQRLPDRVRKWDPSLRVSSTCVPLVYSRNVLDIIVCLKFFSGRFFSFVYLLTFFLKDRASCLIM